MKTKFKKLALTAMLLSSSSMAMADNGTSIIGDLPGYGEDAYFDEDAAYADEQTFEADQSVAYDNEEAAEQIAPVGHTERSVVTRAPRRRSVSTPAHAAAYTPVQASQLQPVTYYGDDCGCGPSGGACGVETISMNDCGCGSSSCGGGCGVGRRMNQMFNSCDTNAWASLEALLWFVEPRDTAPLVLGAPTGTLPSIGQQGVTTLFGGQGENELSAGFRVDGGVWLSDHVGIGGRFWMLDDSGDSFNYNGNGTGPSVGRSFFNTSPGVAGEDAIEINQAGRFRGNLQAESSLDIMAAEAYARLRLGRGQHCNVDLIGGYSHFNIDDSLSIRSETINLITIGGNPAGLSRSFVDQFDTENEFNGGQIGFDMIMQRGCWTVSSLTKVHLGNMNQMVNVRGSKTRDERFVGSNVAPVTQAGGVLAGVNPNGTPVSVERDVFAFAPEANFKIGYNFRKNVAFTVGYSFIYFDNVALNGGTIDRMVDGVNVTDFTNPTFNGVNDGDDGLWVHGLDLGVVIDF
ncbi:hypothetical protein Poly51_00380 [Rubripirellula tenax]|uniref:Uncharacterized protein n=1 Tax=Rubripirellula tenax TaxID=2528015 RepID=A0A5C6FDB4_9BACT|nr:BBP7 family outer membrane beta-barrel protein [Rubripirellula tenax]TWU59766.1 hypothetical protein Poly51_00380 [Rubripirellula tenax]